MNKILILATLIPLGLTQPGFAKVVFLPGNEVQGNGRAKGALVCVEPGRGRVANCIPLESKGNPGHSNTSLVVGGHFVDDTGGWLYHNDPTDPLFGHIQVNCSHPDLKGVAWLNY
jgi:hypothetical protein